MEHPTPEYLKRWQRYVCFAACLGLLAAVSWGYWRATWASDVAMYSVAGDMLLEGKRPYLDIMDINPPLIMYIHAGFSAVARAMGVDSLKLFAVAVLAASFASALLAGWASRRERWGWMCALGAFAPAVHALYTFQFGQREQLFMLAFLPYLSARWKDQHKSLLFALAVIAGSFACLKPDFFAEIFIFEALLFWRRREKTPLIWAALVSPSVIYLLHFLLWPPEARQVFWLSLVPQVLRFYRNMAMPWGLLLSHWRFAVAGYAALAFGFVWLGRRVELLGILGWLAIFALGSALYQQKAWEYHLLPALYFLGFGFPLFLEAWWRDFTGLFRTGGAVLAAALLLAHSASALTAYRQLPEYYDRQLGFSELAAIARPGDQVLIFSPNSWFSYPQFRILGLRPGSRYLFLFPLAFHRVHRHWSPDHSEDRSVSPEERAFANELHADIDALATELIIFPKRQPLWWRPGAPPYNGLAYAQKMQIFDSHDPRYSQIADGEHFIAFRRKTPADQ